MRFLLLLIGALVLLIVYAYGQTSNWSTLAVPNRIGNNFFVIGSDPIDGEGNFYKCKNDTESEFIARESNLQETIARTGTFCRLIELGGPKDWYLMVRSGDAITAIVTSLTYHDCQSMVAGSRKMGAYAHCFKNEP